MRREDPNRAYLLVVASALGDLCNEVVFVGGSVGGLLITDPVAEGIRATKDVDAIIEAMPGLLTDESRVSVVLSRLRSMAA